MPNKRPLRTGWETILVRVAMGSLLIEMLTGLAITAAPFHAATQWSVLVHTVLGGLTVLPLLWYALQHWLDYRDYAPSHVTVLGYVALAGLAVCSVSGLVITGQALLGVRTSGGWRQTHLVSTLVLLVATVPHVAAALRRLWREGRAGPAGRVGGYALGTGAAGAVAIAILAAVYPGTRFVNRFPDDYHYLYGTNRPFAPSLARTDTGGAFDERSLAGSESCGTAGCHEQIVEEWQPSAHRYAAMDTVFLGIQEVMAKQNGPESTRYCGGCHDPISLFAGAKNLYSEELTGAHGYQEGVSCLGCHAIRETDVKGNANYTVTQPTPYLWQWEEATGLPRLARDFLIRTYPAEHNKLSKRMFKKPEYCAACHKQFIDKEVNRVGWVQLQNQYDNWAASHWNHKGDATKTVECRECHMPLVDSRDPAAGDAADYNRRPGDGKHRSHRFLAANQLMPWVLRDKLEGWQEQMTLTERWLQGRIEVPEISAKWANGPLVKLSLVAPDALAPGAALSLRVIMASNKVGHDFPTGPLDIIQSWLEVRVTDDAGREVFVSGARDTNHFIQTGSFLFKAEPVDQYGNLIDRHNLWEMVGVRYRRALFPGYSDTVQFTVPCSAALVEGTNAAPGKSPQALALDEARIEVPAPAQPGSYRVTVALQYRKVDQFLLNYLFGATNGLTAPVTEIARATATVRVQGGGPATGDAAGNRESRAARLASAEP